MKVLYYFYSLPQKVILPGYLGDIRWSTYYSTNYHRYREFADIEKVMCYLTGTDYDKIESLERLIGKVKIGDTDEHDSQFFRFRCFKKGTLHLRFKDERLWSAFNIKACQGKNWLPS